MKITLMHNSKAGVSKSSRETIEGALHQAGHEVTYKSVKEGGVRSELRKAVDAVVIAGGDGTIGKVCKKHVGNKTPIGLLPVGTANNIARSLGLEDNIATLIANWSLSNKKKFKVGLIKGSTIEDRFIESLGFGILSKLINDHSVDAASEQIQEADDELKHAIQFLLKILEDASAGFVELKLDGKDFSGNYLLVEIMNIKCIGPNLFLAPDADPSHEQFEVVLVTESEKSKLVDYLTNRLQNNNIELQVPVHKARNIYIKSSALEAHVDDDLHPEIAGQELNITVDAHFLEFM